MFYESTHMSYTFQIPPGSFEAEGVMSNPTHTYLPGWFLLGFQREHISRSGMPSNERLGHFIESWLIPNQANISPKFSHFLSAVCALTVVLDDNKASFCPSWLLSASHLAAIEISGQPDVLSLFFFFFSRMSGFVSNMKWTSWGSMVYLVCVV